MVVAGSQNTGRGFINLKPRDQRKPMKEVVDGLRNKLKAVPGITVFLRPTQTCSSVVVQVRANISTSCKASMPARSVIGRSRCKDKLRSDPGFKDVTTDSQLRGLQASIEINRDRANSGCRY